MSGNKIDRLIVLSRVMFSQYKNNVLRVRNDKQSHHAFQWFCCYAKRLAEKAFRRCSFSSGFFYLTEYGLKVHAILHVLSNRFFDEGKTGNFRQHNDLIEEISQPLIKKTFISLLYRKSFTADIIACSKYWYIKNVRIEQRTIK